MTPRLRLALVLVCFFLSGFAALIYQTAWTRLFAFVFGTSELAVATVLAAYMGGLAAGAAVATRFVRRVRRPVLVYGVLELGIALAALAVPFAMRGATALYVALFRGGDSLGEAGGAATLAFYLAASFAILLVPTGLMGATLPLLTRYAVRSEAEIGPRVSLLYTVNTVGAVAGAVCAGFVLLPALGLAATQHVAIAANALVFGAAALASRGAPLPADEAPAAAQPAVRGAGTWVLPWMLVSGAISFSYEVLWSRLLGHLLGGSVLGFATMLASFLTGIAIGSAFAARFARDARMAARALAGAQVGAAALSYLAFLALDRMPALARAVAGHTGAPLAADAVVAAATLLPGALCIGATFPLAVRVLARRESDAGPASARVYAWNTLGAIVGSVATGFYLLPALGYAGLLTLGVALELLLAGVALRAAALPPLRLALAAGAAAVAGALLLPPELPWRLLRSSAISSRTRGANLYLGVGRSATVLLLEEGAGWRLRTNGLPESLIFRRGARAGDSLAQWLANAASLARPEARSMLVIGFGGGVVLEAIPPLIESVDVVELEPEVIRANERVAEVRRENPLADPRLKLIFNDARGALQLATRRYDVIASQPSHPWTGGAAHLYTREFFELARAHLAPDGVLAQWMALHFVDEESLRALVGSLVDVFGNVRVYQPSPGALLLLASPEPLRLEENAPAALARAPATFHEIGVFGPEGAAAALALDEEGSRRFADGAARNTDDRNLLEMRSFAVSRAPQRSLADRDPFDGMDSLVGPTPGLDRVALVRRLLSRNFEARARRVAEATQDPVARATARGWLALETGRPRAAERDLGEALAQDPSAAQARAAMLRLRRHAIAKGDDDPARWLASPRDLELAVAAGWRAERQLDWDAVRALEPRLAQPGASDPLYDEALRLRVAWRSQQGDVALAREALTLADTLISASCSIRDEILRARVLAAAGDAEAAIVALAQAGIASSSRSEGEREVAREARRMVATLPQDASASDVEAAIRERFF